MIHNITKTQELPNSKCRVHWLESKDEVEALAGENDAYLLPVKDGYYLFIVEAK